MTFSYKKEALYIDDISLSFLAQQYGTPLYVYSAQRIEDNFISYQRAFEKIAAKKAFTICYAMKANSHQAVLRLLQTLGAGADIVSGGELKRALAAKIPAKKIVYSGVGKTEEELTLAIKSGIGQINIESEFELGLISKIAVKQRKKIHIALRINPNVDAGTHKKITTGTKEDKFGIDIDDAPALYDRARKMPGIIASGVAVHIGSQLTSLAPYARAYKRVADLVSLLRRRGHNITTIDIGGGIGITYKNEKPLNLDLYARMVRDTLMPLGVHIILEPGRSIVGNAGVLVSTVMQVKKGSHKNFTIIDAAMNDLIRPTLYDAYHALLPCRRIQGQKIKGDVVGPVCESGDTFLVNEPLPPLKTGDIVCLMTSGAYGSVMSSNYNTRPKSAEVMVRGKKHALISPRQSVEALIRSDKIPDWIA